MLKNKRQYIRIKYRLRGNPKAYAYLSGLAGANRHLWNTALSKILKDYKETDKSDFSYYTLGKWYTKYKRDQAKWLSNYVAWKSKLVLKDLSVAMKEYVQNNRARPKFKSKRNRWSFPIGLYSKEIKNNKYLLIKEGVYMKMIGHQQIERYSNPKPKQARIIREVEDRSNPKNKKNRNKNKHNKWFLSVVYEVDAEEIPIDSVGIGIDRNVGQVADNKGNIYELADIKKQEKQIAITNKKLSRKKRGSNRRNKTRLALASHHRKKTNQLKNSCRHIAKSICRKSNLIFLEDLKTKNLLKSAKGTVDKPGKNVKAKSGLSRVIQNSLWYFLECELARHGLVCKVPAAYTSQKCSECGFTDKDNRTSQSKFKCLECGLSMNADTNAAINIWTLGIGDIQYVRGVCIRPKIAKGGPGQPTMKRKNEYFAF